MRKIDRIVNNLKEMMVANPPGQSGGFSGNSSASGPTAGFDPVLDFVRKKRSSITNKVDYRKVDPKLRKWLKSVENVTQINN